MTPTGRSALAGTVEAAVTGALVSVAPEEGVPFPDVKPLSLVVDALLRLCRLDQQIDELLREPRSARERLDVRAAHGGLAARIEHRLSRVALRLPDGAGDFQTAPDEHRD